MEYEPPIYTLKNIFLSFGSNPLFSDVDLHLTRGSKSCLIGRNGSGKSTLLKVIAGLIEPDGGEIFIQPGTKISYMPQESDFRSFASLRDIVVAGLGSHKADEEYKADILIKEFDIRQEQSPQNASGGELKKAALAQALISEPDILLLDEPTNHLDLEASIWLISHLRKYQGTLILISHDKEILNTLCNYIVHVEAKKLVSYTGNYDTFQKTRTLQRQLQSKAAEKQNLRRKHLQSFVDRFRYKATKAKQAQSRLKMIAKMQEIPEPEEDVSSHFTFPNPVPLSPPLLTMEKVSCGYKEHVVLRDLSLQLAENDRIALLGANGNGKSTFAKLVSGKIKEMSGHVHRCAKLKIGYFVQHQAEELPLYQTPAAFMASLMPSDTHETAVRAHLARFGLTKEKALTKIENLSGGEKARLLFAAMTYEAPALLILDEPTNHLDIPGRDALIDALNEYTGAVILITHDLNLIQLIADDLWLVKDGRCKEFHGDLDDYRRMLTDDKKAAKKDEKAKTPKVNEKPAAVRPSFNEMKAMKGQVARLEKKLAELSDKKEALESLFLNKMEPQKIVETQKELTYVAQEIDAAEQEWLSLSEKLEGWGIK